MDASSDFFEVDGLVINNRVAIASGSGNPIVDLLDLPLGSFYIRDNGELWTKNSTGWGLISNPNVLESLEELIVYNNGEPELLFMNDQIVKVRI